MTMFLFLLLLVLATWYWADSLRASEIAVLRARTACTEVNMQLLDNTVALETVKPTRHASGWLVPQRTYRFEFSADGADRRSGGLTLVGHKVVSVHMNLPQGVTILEGEYTNVYRIH